MKDNNQFIEQVKMFTGTCFLLEGHGLNRDLILSVKGSNTGEILGLNLGSTEFISAH